MNLFCSIDFYPYWGAKDRPSRHWRTRARAKLRTKGNLSNECLRLQIRRGHPNQWPTTSGIVTPAWQLMIPTIRKRKRWRLKAMQKLVRHVSQAKRLFMWPSPFWFAKRAGSGKRIDTSRFAKAVDVSFKISQNQNFWLGQELCRCQIQPLCPSHSDCPGRNNLWAAYRDKSRQWYALFAGVHQGNQFLYGFVDPGLPSVHPVQTSKANTKSKRWPPASSDHKIEQKLATYEIRRDHRFSNDGHDFQSLGHSQAKTKGLIKHAWSDEIIWLGF